jgi:hypothetical protein
MLEDTLSSQMIDSLRSAWTARARDLSRQRYERYADLLYAHLLNHLTAQKTITFNHLLAKIQTATKPQDLEVPLWTYTSCYSKVREEPVFDTRIGTKVFGTPALPTVSIYKVVHETDLLHRLAAAYGTEFYIYDRHVETLQANDRRVQSRRELVLTYYPCGLPETLYKRVKDATARQLTRIPYSPSWAETLSLVEPLQTPPPSRPSTPPPQRQRRCPCEYDEE